MATKVASRLPSGNVLNAIDIRRLASVKVFFGHKSVGENILDGIRQLLSADPRLNLNVIKSSDPLIVAGPAFIESEIGENGNALSKIAAFAHALRNGLGPEGGIALFKYCYVDIMGCCNVADLFARYGAGMKSLQAQHPNVTFIHVTVPLTTVEPAAKAWMKDLLGRETARAANVKRNEFNRLLRQTYPSDSIFDLAKVESTHPDGSRCCFMRGREQIDTLAEEYTNDGGHLNALGSKAAAREMLMTLARAAIPTNREV